jgi:hypothetical protein
MIQFISFSDGKSTTFLLNDKNIRVSSGSISNGRGAASRLGFPLLVQG